MAHHRSTAHPSAHLHCLAALGCIGHHRCRHLPPRRRARNRHNAAWRMRGQGLGVRDTASGERDPHCAPLLLCCSVGVPCTPT